VEGSFLFRYNECKWKHLHNTCTTIKPHSNLNCLTNVYFSHFFLHFIFDPFFHQLMREATPFCIGWCSIMIFNLALPIKYDTTDDKVTMHTCLNECKWKHLHNTCTTIKPHSNLNCLTNVYFHWTSRHDIVILSWSHYLVHIYDKLRLPLWR
jgi:hypothetical protein